MLKTTVFLTDTGRFRGLQRGLRQAAGRGQAGPQRGAGGRAAQGRPAGRSSSSRRSSPRNSRNFPLGGLQAGLGSRLQVAGALQGRREQAGRHLQHGSTGSARRAGPGRRASGPGPPAGPGTTVRGHRDRPGQRVLALRVQGQEDSPVPGQQAHRAEVSRLPGPCSMNTRTPLSQARQAAVGKSRGAMACPARPGPPGHRSGRGPGPGGANEGHARHRTGWGGAGAGARRPASRP